MLCFLFLYLCKGLPSFYVTSYFLQVLLFKDLVEYFSETKTDCFDCFFLLSTCLLSLSEKYFKFVRHVFPLQKLSCLVVIFSCITSTGCSKPSTFSETGPLSFFFFQSIENTFVAVIYGIKTLLSRGISDMLFHYSNCSPKVFILYPVVNWISDNN